MKKEQNENELEYVSIFHFYEQLNKLEIVGLYEYDDEYQVIDSNRTVLFQGRKLDCKKYIKNNGKHKR